MTRLGILAISLLLASSSGAWAGDDYLAAGALGGIGQSLQQGAATLQSGITQRMLMEEQHAQWMRAMDALTAERDYLHSEQAAIAKHRAALQQLSDEDYQQAVAAFNARVTAFNSRLEHYEARKAILFRR
jgi:hypothetical protein